jgi:hypothetical protein
MGVSPVNPGGMVAILSGLFLYPPGSTASANL